MLKISKCILKILSFFIVFLFSGFLISPAVQAQGTSPFKSYQYDSILTTIKINRDSTFDVQESQVFNYKGSFHQAFRSILIRKIDSISDIEVIDGQNNKPLIYSSSKLDKTDPSSWNKFTYYKQNGYQYIEWYYDLSNTTYTWIVKYKVHGGIEFNKTSDRLYWNIFSDFTVPVKSAQAVVILPGELTSSQVPLYSYRTVRKPVEQKFITQNSTASFSSSDFVPNEALTIDVSWPKGYVNQASYWVDFVKTFYGYVFSLLIILVSIVTFLLLWLFREKLPNGKGTIVPEYQPPENLRPAMAEVITKERLTEKGFAATIIDFAVRGYLRIEEQKKSKLPIYILGGVVSVVALVFILSFYLSSLSSLANIFGFGLSADSLQVLLIVSVLVFVILVLTSPLLIKNFLMTDYVLTAVRPYKSDPNLHDYEKHYLDLLFGPDNRFSTKDLRNSSTTSKREFYNAIKKVKDDVYEETEVDTKAFDVDLITEKKRNAIWTGIGIALFALIYGQLKLRIPPNQFEALLVAIVACGLGLWSYIKYEARLNKEGRILREEWLGFKLYLEVAEKYRMQKLTPDLFEKYLPYAMIFGVEKKWAKAFDSLNMAPPSWYYGGYYVHSGYGGSSATVSSFSPPSFSASFPSSFSSSFASSGASGGGGGGGGGAGGGGGGGGGGAS